MIALCYRQTLLSCSMNIIAIKQCVCYVQFNSMVFTNFIQSFNVSELGAELLLVRFGTCGWEGTWELMDMIGHFLLVYKLTLCQTSNSTLGLERLDINSPDWTYKTFIVFTEFNLNWMIIWTRLAFELCFSSAFGFCRVVVVV